MKLQLVRIAVSLAAAIVLSQSAFAAVPLTLDQIRDGTAPGMSAAAELQKTVEKKSTWISERLKREFNRFRIRLTVGLRGEEIGLGDELRADAYYRVIIDPNYRDGEHLRRDTYVFGLGVNQRWLAGAQIRVTFTRIFSGPNARLDAILAKPYWVGRIPLSSSEFKTHLKSGDSVRLELLGRVGGGTSDARATGRLNTSLGLSYVREAMFMMDAYKHSESLVRVRFLGVKNRGVVGVGLHAERPPIFSSLPGKLRRLFAIGGGADASTTLGLADKYPIESWILDYAFPFSSFKPGPVLPDSPEAALDDLLREMRRLSFGSIFNPAVKVENERSWFDQASAAASLASLNESTPQDSRVRHLIKARMRSSLTNFGVRVELSELATMSSRNGYMTSFIETEDATGGKQYFVFENNHMLANTRAFFGRHDDLIYNDTNFLIRSNVDGDILETLDIVMRSESRGKVLTGRELSERAQRTEELLPQSLRGSGKIEAFIPTVNQENARMVSEVSLGQAAVSALGQVSQSEFIISLYNFLERHPRRFSMGLESEMEESSVSLGEIAERYGYQLARAFDVGRSAEERWRAIYQLQRDQVFQRWILPEFVSSLLPGTDAASLVRLRVDFSSDETPTRRLELGSNSVSSVYDAASFVRTILATRDFDLRDETLRDETLRESVASSLE